MTRRALLIAACLLVLAAPAHGAPRWHARHPLTLALAAQIAQRTWGTPDCKSATYSWGADYPSDYAVAFPTLCKIEFTEAVLPQASLTGAIQLDHWNLACTIMVHEWGHLEGQQHSADWRNVMYAGDVLVTYWRCWRAYIGENPFV